MSQNVSSRQERNSGTKPRRKWRKRVWWVVVVPLTVASVSAIVLYYYAKTNAQFRLTAAINAVRERGEPLWFNELKPEPLPPSEDGTQFLLRAIELHESIVAKDNVPNALNYDSIESLFVADIAQDDLAALRQQIRQEVEVIDLINEVKKRGRVQLPQDYDRPQPFFYFEFDPDPWKQIALLLMADAAISLSDGDVSASLERLDDLLMLSHAMRDEPRLITHLARKILADAAVDGLSHVLARAALDDSQRLQMDAALEQLERSFMMRPVVLAERAALWTTLQDPSFFGDAEDISYFYRKLTPLQLDDQAAMLDLMQHDADIADDPTPGLTAENQRRYAAVRDSRSSFIVCNVFLTSHDAARTAGFSVRQHLRNARIALRVDRFYRREGRFPLTLEQISHEFETAPLSAIPALHSQRPVVYRTSVTGIKIYDMGENLVDGELRPLGNPEDIPRPQPDAHELGTLVEIMYATSQ